jgi:outer membrane protein TolC
MKSKIYFLVLFWLLAKAASGQSVLDGYIQEGFAKNQSIQQQQIVLEKSMYALKEARTLFLPKMNLQADYFLAGGGRTVDFPAGTLLNPVYGSLNQLTNSNNFPQLENQSILLNPDNFYDVKVRTTLPLYNPEIGYNKKIKQEQISLQEKEVNLYKRELAKDIKVAYFKYLQAMAAEQIYQEALVLANENRRINESLYKNDKANRTVVLRAENEQLRYQNLLQNARKNSHSAKTYFNFLLNRNLTDSISIAPTSYQQPAIVIESNDAEQREELQKLRIAGNINTQLEGLNRSYRAPRLSTFLDLGSQGFDGQINNKTAYYFFGLSLQWELFSFGKNTYKSKQAALESKALQVQSSYVIQQLEVQYITALNSFQAAAYSYESAMSALNTAQKFYSDMSKLYKSGQALFIELLDAQNQLVQAELQAKISLYDTYIKAAEVERANASFNIK